MNEPLLLFSKFELLFQGLVQHFLSSVLHLQGTDNSFLSEVSLNLDLGVLLPRSHALWHFEFDLLFKENVHLLLDGVSLSSHDEGSSVVDTGHLVEVFMQIGEATHHIELGVEDILSVASILHSIIHDELDHNFSGLFAVE